MTAETDIRKFAADLRSNDWYTKKHALWMLVRHVQLHGGKEVAKYDIFQILADGISDPDDTIRARSIWLVGLLAKNDKELGQKLRDLGAVQLLKNMLDDDTEASICKPNSGELEWTTIGELAKIAIGELG